MLLSRLRKNGLSRTAARDLRYAGPVGSLKGLREAADADGDIDDIVRDAVLRAEAGSTVACRRCITACREL
jgi:hypothetical protein